METKQKKSGLLLAAAVFGFVYWIALIIAAIIAGKNAQVQVQVGFFEGMSNIVKSLFRGDEGSGWILYTALFFISMPAAAVLSLIAYFRESRKAAYISAVLYLVSFNFISILLCVIGLRPAFLQGRKTMLFIAAYIGIVFALVELGFVVIGGLSDPSAIPFFVYFVITILIAATLNFTGWLKNNVKLSLAAAIAYILSVFGIPLVVLCFIGFWKLKKRREQV
jgi:hypothetical protein